MKKIFIAIIGLGLFTSCSDFLDTVPHDSLSPSIFWKTEKDAKDAVVGCYDGWIDGEKILYWDCTSDIGFNYHAHEGFRGIGDGSMTAANAGSGFYDFSVIRRCNTFLDRADGVNFSNPAEKKDLIAQVRVIRAFQYFQMNFWYGGVPIIKDYQSAQEAQVARNTEAEVKKYVYDELDAAISDLNKAPAQVGRIAQGTALAIKMRSALYWGDYQRALDAAHAIQALNLYELEPGASGYSRLFTLAGKSSKEIIYSTQYIMTLKGFWLIGAMYNNADGGWSSIVPTQNLVDSYEMADGLTKEESTTYDPTHPFAGRDPRMALTILYPGMDWNGSVLNTLDKTLNGKANPNYPLAADNSSKTGLTYAKYLTPFNQYSDMWDTDACPIAFRYAEVLLTIAEAKIELGTIDEEVYNAIDAVRQRVGMPAVDRVKYGSKDKLRELVRRERCVEFAGEGLRRADIVRWTDNAGKMVAETVMNGDLYRAIGTISYEETDPYRRAVITAPSADNAALRKIETRAFAPKNRYLPFSQSSLDKNPNLKQNSGY